MPILDEIKLQIDGLKPEEQAEIAQYLATKKVATWDIVQNLQSTESKEVAKKSLEFEEDTFKIDSTSWKEETRTVNGASQKVKVSPQGDVIEYLEWPAKGEQLFITYDSFIQYVAQAKWCSTQEVEQKYLLTKEELQAKMKQVNYTEFYNSQIKGHLAGFWNPNGKKCYDVGKRSDIWLAGGHNAAFNQNDWICNDNYASFGFSGRLLKN